MAQYIANTYFKATSTKLEFFNILQSFWRIAAAQVVYHLN